MPVLMTVKIPHPKRKRAKIDRSLESWLLILSVTFISLVAFETIAVATAMPFVVEILDGENLYALASGIVLATQLMTTALAGPWCDAKGPKPSLYSGSALFAVGLLIATFAPSIEVIVAGRAIQGLGGGLMVVPLYVMVGNYVRAERQPAFFAAFSAAWVVPSLVGPLIAGFLVEHVHWRWVFGITPLLLVVILPIAFTKFRLFPDLHEHHAVLNPGRTFWFAFGTGIAVATLQVLSGRDGAITPVFLATIFVISVVAFALVRYLVPAGTFVAKRGVPGTVLMRGLLNGTFIAVELFLPLMLKNIHGWSPTQAGLILTTGSVTWAIGSAVQGRILNPNRRRYIPTVAAITQLTGMALTILAVLPSISGLVAIAGWLLAGLGIGLAYPALTVHALGLTPPTRHGEVSAALQIADTMGAATCVAYAGIVFALTQVWDNYAFAAAIGLMCVIMFSGVWVSTRVDDGERKPTVRDVTAPRITSDPHAD